MHEPNSRSFHIAGTEEVRKKGFAIAPLDPNHLVFGGASAIGRILAPDGSAPEDAALLGLLPEAAQDVQAWGVFLPKWFGFHYDEPQLLRCDVRGRSNVLARGVIEPKPDSTWIDPRNPVTQNRSPMLKFFREDFDPFHNVSLNPTLRAA